MSEFSEPWRLTEDPGSDHFGLVDDRGDPVCWIPFGGFISREYAERAALCVNACVGVPSAGLELEAFAGLEAALVACGIPKPTTAPRDKQVRCWCFGWASQPCIDQPQCLAARAALARCKLA